ncbi:M56 family metallopeptidase [Actinomadura sp. 3N407]|uniref:M56 family metallopeptidase n=1 Tax=Actinomadura sp. 3N407 TaxID=3457423 RepID=UPI003FCD8FAC
MRSADRTLMHAGLLGPLIAGAVCGALMVGGFLVMVIGAVTGRTSVPELTVSRAAFGVLMALLWGGVITTGLTALIRQFRRNRKLSRWVASAAVSPSPDLVTAMDQVRGRHPVVEIAGEAPYAFTHGIWRPAVVISSGLVERAARDELVALLHHEDYHVRHRDPLKVLVLRTWGAAFFVVPLVGVVLQRFLDRQELRADRAAVRRCGVAAVAGAMLKATGEPAGRPGTAMAAMGGPALLEARVAQLETGRSPRVITMIGRGAVLRSLPGAAVIAVYGVFAYRLCGAAGVCCMS